MVAKLGGLRYFDEALEAGEIKETRGADGKAFYAFTYLECSKEDGKEMRKSMSSESPVDDDNYSKLPEALMSLTYSFSLTKAEQKARSRKHHNKKPRHSCTIRAETHKHRPQPLGV